MSVDNHRLTGCASSVFTATGKQQTLTRYTLHNRHYYYYYYLLLLLSLL